MEYEGDHRALPFARLRCRDGLSAQDAEPQSFRTWSSC